MSVSALDVVSVVQAIREGVILLDDLTELIDADIDLTEAEANAIINDNISELVALRDNDY